MGLLAGIFSCLAGKSARPHVETPDGIEASWQNHQKVNKKSGDFVYSNRFFFVL